MSDADILAEDVLSVLNEVGTPATLVSPGTQTYSPDTGDVASDGEQSYACTSSPPLQYDQKFVGGELIEQGDAACWIAAYGLSVPPVQGWQLSIINQTWTIVSVKTVYLNATAIAYKLQVRK